MVGRPRRIQLGIVRSQLLRENLRVAGDDHAAVDEDGAVLAEHHDAVLVAADAVEFDLVTFHLLGERLAVGAVEFLHGGAATVHGDGLGSVRVGVLHLEGGVAVVAIAGVERLGGFEYLDVGRAVAVHAEAPLRDVDVVRAPVGHLAATVIVPPAEFVVAVRLVLVVLPFEAVGHLRGRPQPHVPVEFLGRLDFLDRSAGRVAADAALDARDLADATGANHIGREAELRHLAALLAPGLEHLLRLLHGLLEEQGFLDGQRQRLLAVHVLALAKGFERDQRVPVIGDRDDHRVHVLAGHHFAVVLVAFDVEAVLLHLGHGSSEVAGVHIADGGEVDVLEAAGFADEGVRAAGRIRADPDDGHVQLAVGVRLLVVFGGASGRAEHFLGVPGWQPSRGHRRDRSLHEPTAREVSAIQHGRVPFV